MAQPYVTGPCHIFLGIPSGSVGPPTPAYLGTCERSPRVLIRPHYADYFNDIMGQMIPYDKIFQGEDGYILADLNRWNEQVFASYQARPRIGAGVRGSLVPGDMGAMVKSEGMSMICWLLFTYSAKPQYSQQPAGMFFPAVIGEGPDELDNLGTMARRNRIVLYCSPVLVPLSNGSVTGFGQQLYNTIAANFSGLAGLIT